MPWPCSTHAHSWHLPPPLSSMVKLSLFTHVHSSRRRHRCRISCSHYNQWLDYFWTDLNTGAFLRLQFCFVSFFDQLIVCLDCYPLRQSALILSPLIAFFFFFPLKIFQMGEEREKGRETSMCGCLSQAPCCKCTDGKTPWFLGLSHTNQGFSDCF